jgi:hypothetical protein
MKDSPASTGSYRATVDNPVPSSPISAHYLHAKVSVHYQNQFTDAGTITYIDDAWVELTKESGERLLIPTPAIRIIKWIETAKHTGDAAILLRPVDENLPDPKRPNPK